MNKWKIDTKHLLEIVAQNMYSNPLEAGLREIIQNGLDAKTNGKINIEITIGEDYITYMDDGKGIDPDEFTEVYGKIASGHERVKHSRGIFGIGRMSFITQSSQGQISTMKDGKEYTWRFTIDGWDEPIVTDSYLNYGVKIIFNGISVSSPMVDLKTYILKAFAIPLYTKECEIILNKEKLQSPIPEDALVNSEISKEGPIMVYHHPKIDGKLFICQKGILVKEEDYIGLEAWADQSFLTIKTDREGFVNDAKYRFFMKEIKRELALFRPVQTFKKMEVDFIKSLMKGFKRYWIKKIAMEVENIPLKLEFPEAGKEVMEEKEGELPEATGTTQTEEGISQPLEPIQPDTSGMFPEKENDWSKIPTVEEVEENIAKSQEDTTSTVARQAEPPTSSAVALESEKLRDVSTINEGHEDIPGQVDTSQEVSEQPAKEPKSEERTVMIKGAKPVEMGEDYPVIFYEKDPFVLLFNTNHPIFKKMVEKGKINSHEIAVLFERIFECAYIADKKQDDTDEKERWKEVDKRLKELFK